MEQILSWINQNQTLSIMLAIFGLIIFIVSLKHTSTKIFSSNRGVSIGGNSSGMIITGDINSNQPGILNILANIATILGLIVGAATLYITYLAFTSVG